jgi:transcriptional regulator with XRE-family HTH domain
VEITEGATAIEPGGGSAGAEHRAQTGPRRAATSGRRTDSLGTVSKNELGAFLRSRREAVQPSEVGLAAGARRRTPGLRRAELATLAGVSVEYLARLEQGRDRHPSPQVLDALVTALRLPADDLLLLGRIVKAASGRLLPVVGPPGSEVRPTVRMLLDRLEPTPAVVINRLTDVLACTNGFARLMAPIGLLDRTPANLVRFALADPRARTAYPNWAAVADARVASLRLPSHRADPHLGRLVDELGPAVTSRTNVPAAAAGVEEMRHPDAGALRLAFEVLTLPDADDQQLIVYLPADESTSDRLDRLLRTGPTALPSTVRPIGSRSRPAG